MVSGGLQGNGSAQNMEDTSRNLIWAGTTHYMTLSDYRTLYVGMAPIAPPPIQIQIKFLLTRLPKALYDDLPV